MRWTYRLAFVGALALFGLSGATPTRAEPVPGQDASLAINHYSYFDGWPSEPYLLDPIERFLPQGERLRCDASGMVLHRDRALRYAVRVHPAFVERLERFETLVTELATAFAQGLEHFDPASLRQSVAMAQDRAGVVAYAPSNQVRTPKFIDAGRP